MSSANELQEIIELKEYYLSELEEKINELSSEKKALRTKIILFLSSLIFRANDISETNKAFMLSYDAEISIINFIEEMKKDMELTQKDQTQTSML